MMYFDEQIWISRNLKDVLINLKVWTQDYVDYLERNEMIYYVEDIK